ncbi:hypothetical protein ACTXT7_012055 [Hymenolepis weldensis]
MTGQTKDQSKSGGCPHHSVTCHDNDVRSGILDSDPMAFERALPELSFLDQRCSESFHLLMLLLLNELRIPACKQAHCPLHPFRPLSHSLSLSLSWSLVLF